MTSELVQEIVRFYEEDVQWPTQDAITPEAKEGFDKGRSILDTYREDPDVLLEAFNTFIATDCLPYAYAGAALVLDKAAFDPGDEDDGDDYALEQAKSYLEKAQELAGECFEIDLIEVTLYASSKEYQAMRLCLDYLADTLSDVYPDNLRFHQAEMDFWFANPDPDKFRDSYEKAMQAAETDSERLTLTSMLARFYFRGTATYPQALEIYHKLARVTPDDAWVWHNLSVIYLHQKKYPEAHRCNQQALKLMDFTEAREVESMIHKQRAG